LDQGEIGRRINQLSRLGRQRDFPVARFRKSLNQLARHENKQEILRQLLIDWTGLPHSAREALERWEEVESILETLREALGSPVSLQTALLHNFHSRRGLLKEPRLLSDKDLAVQRVNAITDPLTGLYNRRFLLEHLGREISRAERTHGIVSVLLTDLKNFKGINDQFGHPVGDTVLVRTAKVIRDLLRVVDAGCRWGGDEFVVVLPNTDLFSAFSVTDRIRRNVASSALPGRTGFALGMHYGIASYPADGRTADFLLKVADLRLYQCREQSSFSRDRRQHPRCSPSDMTLKIYPNRNGGPWTVPVLDLGFGGIAFKARTGAGKPPPHWKAEIAHQSDPERHAIRLRAISSAPLTSGGIRVGCSYE
jgi:diguanylate cyclase (GGDEF)-like protein